jgi:CheY-like chemotaxis protein
VSLPIQGHQADRLESSSLVISWITDVYSQMPFMSGVEVVRALREVGNPLYVVGCTGNALREDQVRHLSMYEESTDIQDEYLKAGADGIIPKPVHQKSVLEQIKLARKRVAGETKPKALQPSD